jgi:hypothetical protein
MAAAPETATRTPPPKTTHQSLDQGGLLIVRKLDWPGGAGGDDLRRCAARGLVGCASRAFRELEGDLERDRKVVATYAEVDEIEAMRHRIILGTATPLVGLETPVLPGEESQRLLL